MLSPIIRPASNGPHLYQNFSNCMFIKLCAGAILHHLAIGTYLPHEKQRCLLTEYQPCWKHNEETTNALTNGTRQWFKLQKNKRENYFMISFGIHYPRTSPQIPNIPVGFTSQISLLLLMKVLHNWSFIATYHSGIQLNLVFQHIKWQSWKQEHL